MLLFKPLVTSLVVERIFSGTTTLPQSKTFVPQNEFDLQRFKAPKGSIVDQLVNSVPMRTLEVKKHRVRLVLPDRTFAPFGILVCKPVKDSSIDILHAIDCNTAVPLARFNLHRTLKRIERKNTLDPVSRTELKFWK